MTPYTLWKKVGSDEAVAISDTGDEALKLNREVPSDLANTRNTSPNVTVHTPRAILLEFRRRSVGRWMGKRTIAESGE